MKLYETVLGFFFAITIATMFDSCVINPATEIPSPSPTPTPTVVATHTPKPSIPFEVTMPDKVSQGAKFRVTVKADEFLWVSLWVDKKYPLGDMRWDSSNKVKYLDVKLDTRGTRQIWFRVNNMDVYARSIEVTP